MAVRRVGLVLQHGSLRDQKLASAGVLSLGSRTAAFVVALLLSIAASCGRTPVQELQRIQSPDLVVDAVLVVAPYGSGRSRRV